MSFVGYLLLGSLVYVAGFMLHLKVLKPKKQAGMPVKKTHYFGDECVFFDPAFCVFFDWSVGAGS